MATGIDEDLLLSMVDAKINEIVTDRFGKQLNAVIKRHIERTFVNEVKDYTDKLVQAFFHPLLEEWADKTVKGKIVLSDPWEAERSFPSFEAYFKHELKQKFDNDWGMKKIFENYVREQTEHIIRKQSDEMKTALIAVIGRNPITIIPPEAEEL